MLAGFSRQLTMTFEILGGFQRLSIRVSGILEVNAGFLRAQQDLSFIRVYVGIKHVFEVLVEFQISYQRLSRIQGVFASYQYLKVFDKEVLTRFGGILDDYRLAGFSRRLTMTFEILGGFESSSIRFSGILEVKAGVSMILECLAGFQRTQQSLCRILEVLPGFIRVYVGIKHVFEVLVGLQMS